MWELQRQMFYQLVLSVLLLFSRPTAPWKHLIIGGLTTIQSSGRRLRSIRGGVKKNLFFLKWCLNFQDFKMGCGLREAFSLVTILLSNVVKIPIYDDIYLKLKISKTFKILEYWYKVKRKHTHRLQSNLSTLSISSPCLSLTQPVASFILSR